MAKYDFSKYADVPSVGTAPFEELFKPKSSWVKQRKWDIPDVLVIKVAPVGAFLMKEDNPNQKYYSARYHQSFLIKCQLHFYYT